MRKAELGYDRTKLKIHHRHPALLRRSECAGPNAEQWLTDLHLLGRDRMLHSGAALNHPRTTQRNTRGHIQQAKVLENLICLHKVTSNYEMIWW